MKIKVSHEEIVRVFKCDKLDNDTLDAIAVFVKERFHLGNAPFVLQYVDDEKDLVTACDWEDLQDALSVAESEKKTLKLFVSLVGDKKATSPKEEEEEEDALLVSPLPQTPEPPIESTVGCQEEEEEEDSASEDEAEAEAEDNIDIDIDLFAMFFEDLSDESFRNEFASFVCTFLELVRESQESPHTAFVQALSIHERVFTHPSIEKFASKVPLFLGMAPVQPFLAMINPELVPIYIEEAVQIVKGSVPQEPIMPPFLVAILQRRLNGESGVPFPFPFPGMCGSKKRGHKGWRRGGRFGKGRGGCRGWRGRGGRGRGRGGRGGERRCGGRRFGGANFWGPHGHFGPFGQTPPHPHPFGHPFGPHPHPHPPHHYHEHPFGPFGWVQEPQEEPEKEESSKHATRKEGKEKKECNLRLRADIVGESHSLQDGTHVDPKQLFVKTWTLRNSGSDSWPEGTTIQYRGRGNNPMVAQSLFPVKAPVHVGEEVQVSVVIEVPSRPGKFKSNWRLITPSGRKFGEKMTCTLDCGIEQAPVMHAHDEERKRHKEMKRREGIRKKRAKLMAKLEKLNEELKDDSDMDIETEGGEEVDVEPAATVAESEEPVMVSIAPDEAGVEKEEMGEEKAEDKEAEKEAEKESFMYATALATLRGMGFANDELVKELLIAHNGEVHAVINRLTN